MYCMWNKVGITEVLPPDMTLLLNNLLFQSLTLFGMGLTGLGVRRFTKDKVLAGETSNDLTVQQTSETNDGSTTILTNITDSIKDLTNKNQ